MYMFSIYIHKQNPTFLKLGTSKSLTSSKRLPTETIIVDKRWCFKMIDHVTKNARPLQSKDLNQAIYAPTTNYKIDMSTYLSQATERRPKLGKNVQFDNIAFVMFHNTLPGKCNPVNWSSKAAIHIMQVVLKHLWVLNSLT